MEMQTVLYHLVETELRRLMFYVLLLGCLCVLWSYPALVEAAQTGRGGAGRLSRMRSGQLTGRRPVYWRGNERVRK